MQKYNASGEKFALAALRRKRYTVCDEQAFSIQSGQRQFLLLPRFAVWRGGMTL